MNGDDGDGGGTIDPANAMARLEAEMRELRSKYDARFSDMGRQLGKLGKRAPEPEASSTSAPPSPSPAPPASPTPPPSPGGITRAEVRAAIELAQSSKDLPEAARGYLADLASKGASAAELTRAAQFARSMTPAPAPVAPVAPANSTNGAPAAPRIHDAPRTGPPRTSVQHPRTLSEYYALARASPEQKKQLDRDPTFHPEDLPVRE